MQRLLLKAAPKRGEAQVARETDPRDLPAITVRAGDFAWQGRQFGRLQAELRKDPQGLRLTSFGTQSPAFELTGTGTWLAEARGLADATGAGVLEHRSRGRVARARLSGIGRRR